MCGNQDGAAYVRFRPIADIATVRQSLAMQFRPTLLEGRIMIVGIVIAVAVAWLTRTPPPPVESLNGKYRNACCSPVVLTDGVLITDSARFPFKLVLMKYGLDANLGVHLEVVDGKVIRTARPGSTAVSFNPPRTAFVLCSDNCGPGHEFEFSRTEPPKS